MEFDALIAMSNKKPEAKKARMLSFDSNKSRNSQKKTRTQRALSHKVVKNRVDHQIIKAESHRSNRKHMFDGDQLSRLS